MSMLKTLGQMKATEPLLNTFEELWKAGEVYNGKRIGKCECDFKKKEGESFSKPTLSVGLTSTMRRLITEIQMIQ